MIATPRFLTVVTVLLTLAAPRLVIAQEIAGSMEQLRVLVKSGDQVRITDASGRETKGKIADLSGDTLALLVDGQRREVRAADISTIRQRKFDSLATGAKVGFGIGAGFGLLVAFQVLSVYDEGGAGVVTAVSLLYGGLGAGIGVGFDALVTREQVIYAAAPRSAATRAGVKIRPLLSPSRQGVALSFGF